MKTVIFYLVLMVLGTGHAQEFTELKEAKVFAPLSSHVQRDGNNFSFRVKESSIGEFEKDPLAFMESNLDIDNLVKAVADKNIKSIHVEFKSRKGFLKANFNRDGDLIKTSSRFENIILPEDLRHELYRNHKGWEMTKNVHVTISKNGTVKKDYFRIKLEKGKETKKINLEGLMQGTEVASN